MSVCSEDVNEALPLQRESEGTRCTAITPSLAIVSVQPLRCTGGAGQKGGFQNIEGDLWSATKDEAGMDMPEAHEADERGQMAQDGLAGASPSDQATFPSNVEDQASPVFHHHPYTCTLWPSEAP